ncbi:MAG: SUMF1/EgtB/PvdO family nonheme iron enzyme [Desulfovibrionaceae bacterium]|nr:SUMF1/EgtB/PvdO family nonheme iron enzyme [Desulfovibrionaceae bacterium]
MRLLLLVALLVMFSLNTAWAKPHLDPALVLPGPDNVSFKFRPIPVQGGVGYFGGQKFKMGKDSGSFRTPPTDIAVSGNFIHKDQRCYYLGECEVTVGQYLAVMGDKANPNVKGQAPDLPVTNVSYLDVLQFIDTYNKWLYANAMPKLPQVRSCPAFVRLPTEEEWEFAARGGNMVDRLSFDADTPYGDDDLTEYEWFSGPTSSHNKLQKVGKLKPNPLGLYDMLGNVQEMTSALYRVEYYQGRSGGFVARGGHYLTKEDEIISFKRNEEPLYLGTVEKGMRPNSKATLGFRLALSAPILTDRKLIQAMKEAWPDYNRGVGSELPRAISVAAVGKQENASVTDALNRLQIIKEALDSSGIGAKFNPEFALIHDALLQMTKIRKKADEDSAKVWVKIAGERGLFLRQNLQRLKIFQKMREETRRPQVEQRIEETNYNVDLGFQNYGEIMTELGKLPKEFVLQGFMASTARLASLRAKEEERLKNLQAKEAIEIAERRIKDLTDQQKCLEITRQHYLHYEHDKRFSKDAWKKDYETQ